MYMAGRFRTPSRPRRTWMFRASYEWPSLVSSGGDRVTESSPDSDVTSRLLPPPHGGETDGAQLRAPRQLFVQPREDVVLAHREVRHPCRAAHGDDKLPVAHALAAGAPR